MTSDQQKELTVDLSIIVPIYNEEENIADLHAGISAALAGLPLEYEVILVDDGSMDNSFPLLKEIARQDM